MAEDQDAEITWFELRSQLADLLEPPGEVSDKRRGLLRQISEIENTLGPSRSLDLEDAFKEHRLSEGERYEPLVHVRDPGGSRVVGMIRRVTVTVCAALGLLILTPVSCNELLRWKEGDFHAHSAGELLGGIAAGAIAIVLAGCCWYFTLRHLWFRYFARRATRASKTEP